ncbi:MAG: PEGA domain-containing protein [Chloroflexi bacterium]|nr:MAG: PEGA domain-containing protein [Chloroflexota bacterium]
MTNEFFLTHRKKIVIGAILLFVVFVLFSAATYISRSGKIGVTFSIVPGDASLTVNGNKSGKGTQWLTPGTYTIKVEKNGFQTVEKQIIADANKERNVAAVSLTPESDEAKAWAEKNQNLYKSNEEFGSIEAQETGKFLRARHPIIDVLPYKDPYYTVAYRLNNDQSITLTVDTPSPRYRYFAVQKIRELGYNPTDYDIEFKQYKNPLGGSDE